MALADLLNQTCSIAALVSTDAYDKPTYATPVTDIPCRIEGVTKTLRRADDSVVVITDEIWLEPDVVVDDFSQLTLVDGSQPDIYGVDRMPGRNGQTFYIKLLTGVRRTA